MRVTPRSGMTANVGAARDPAGAQHRDELVGRAGAVPDRVESRRRFGQSGVLARDRALEHCALAPRRGAALPERLLPVPHATPSDRRLADFVVPLRPPPGTRLVAVALVHGQLA
jgi:hypothetical protein